MAASRAYADGLKLAVTVALVTVAFVSCLTFLPPKSAAQGLVLSSNGENLQQQRKHMVLGSKPPGCVNKCFSCKPCMATLVVPSHQKDPTFKALSHGDDDDSGRYYLLSWKCRCGNKLFQP
ncbi:EPIDERMAL PATTERNING FACTOR-like protein 8 [Hevea brasiliensis]|uniref:EPIDERMAL PATTERNING FACTOR-like protein 8 n=1 Tax=Hevea brasiliensis TaxID=3981 RepID=UPI0025DB0060|nr:EPIDERMAL PATTERNING FACTOR-like protein 8 [Hevea brasiliensis]